MATPKDNRTPGQLRAAELKAEAARVDRRRRMISIVAGSVVALLVVAFFLSLALKKKNPAAVSTPAAVSFDAPAQTEVASLVTAAGLTMLPNEGGTKFHIHAHLQVLNGGQNVVVPALIGVQEGKGLSPLHTHDDSGAVHVEAVDKADFTLGQFFKEWNVPLSQTCLGAKCADATHDLKVFVDGAAYTGDPTAIVLKDKQDITVAYGDKSASVTPQRFDFSKL